MRVLFKGSWCDVPLDYAKLPGEQWIAVNVFVNLIKIDNAYFQRPKDIRLALNYVREIGCVPTLTKIFSRSAEKRRNDKFMSIGFGYVNGVRPAYFIAPMHPECIDMLALPDTLIHYIDVVNLPDLSTLEQSSLCHLSLVDAAIDFPEGLAHVIGWNAFSGAPVPAFDWPGIAQIILSARLQKARTLPAGARAPRTLAGLPEQAGDGLSATLLGYGNYAKTVIIPNLPKQLRITRIHDVDPLQIPIKIHKRYTCSSESEISADDKNSIFFIASFHHTHAQFACEGLRRNAHVVVEKPLVTSRDQLEDLAIAFNASHGSYFSCFHKRYMLFNDWVRRDLDIGAQEPINYHAIVYEVPLPQKHWYRWPNSRSRIISNGCHWLDHFLYLNHFSKVEKCNAYYAPDGTVNTSVVLENGAFFSMVLTDAGSQRLGVQDYVELRQRDATVIIINGSSYRAENRNRVLRQVRKSRMHSYGNMYQSIGKSLLQNRPGDTWESIAASSSLALDVDSIAMNG